MARINVGEKMPNFVFNTGYRNDVKLDDELAENKTVIWVLRYMGCTVCRYDIHEINKRYDEFKAKNSKVFVLMQSDQAHIQEDFDRTNEHPELEVIADPEMAIYKALDIKPAASMEELAGGPEGLAKLQAKGAKAAAAGFSHGDYEGDEQQLPAMFILDKDGVVTYARYAENIVDLPDVDGVLELL